MVDLGLRSEWEIQFLNLLHTLSKETFDRPMEGKLI